MNEKKEFVRILNSFFGKKVKAEDPIFYWCDSLKIVRLILQLEHLTKSRDQFFFITKRDLFFAIFK
jgi:hypothetical protein